MTGLAEVLSNLRNYDDNDTADCVASLLNAFRRCRKRVTGSDDFTADDIRRFADIIELNMGAPMPAAEIRAYAPKRPSSLPQGSVLARSTSNLRSATVLQPAPLPPLNATGTVTQDMLSRLENEIAPQREASG